MAHNPLTQTQTLTPTGFTGPALRPHDPGFAEEIAGFQTAYTHRPSLMVGAADTEDVRRAVAYAADRGLDVAVQATGHGLSVATDGGVLITTRRMAGVTIDAAAKSARVSAGTRWGAVVDAAARHGLAPVNGSSASVGVIGYLLGGGIGILSRRFGYAADHVRRLQIVTADGQLNTLTPGDDLFGAALGGGGNFGVVTAAEIGLFDLPEVYGGQLWFDTPLIPAALEAWRRWTATAPDEATGSLALIPFPDIPAVPPALRGRHIASIRVAFTGAHEDGDRLVAPLRAIGETLKDDLRTMPYSESGAIYADPDDPHPYAATNAMLSDLPQQALDNVFAIAGPSSPVGCVVDLRHLGGAMKHTGPADLAVDFRGAGYIVRVLSMYTPAATPDAARARHAMLTDALAPWTLGRNLNFVYGDGSHADEAQTREGYTPHTYARLANLKRESDPHNTFRSNRNIRG